MIDPEEIDEDEGWAVYREQGVSRTAPWPPPTPVAEAPPPVEPPAAPRPHRGRWIAAGAAALVAAELIRRSR